MWCGFLSNKKCHCYWNNCFRPLFFPLFVSWNSICEIDAIWSFFPFLFHYFVMFVNNHDNHTYKYNKRFFVTIWELLQLFLFTKGLNRWEVKIATNNFFCELTTGRLFFICNVHYVLLLVNCLILHCCIDYYDVQTSKPLTGLYGVYSYA